MKEHTLLLFALQITYFAIVCVFLKALPLGGERLGVLKIFLGRIFKKQVFCLTVEKMPVMLQPEKMTCRC